MKGIEITYKDGSKEWFDPCDEIIIDTGYGAYTIKVDSIESLKTYKVEEAYDNPELLENL